MDTTDALLALGAIMAALGLFFTIFSRGQEDKFVQEIMSQWNDGNGQISTPGGVGSIESDAGASATGRDRRSALFFWIGALVLLLATVGSAVFLRTNRHAVVEAKYSPAHDDNAPVAAGDQHSQPEGVALRIDVPDYARDVDRARVSDSYRLGSTIPREELLEPQRELISEEWAGSKNWRTINKLKLQALRITSSAHPEVGDYNYQVEEAKEVLEVLPPSGIRSTQQFTVRAAGRWKSDFEQRTFVCKQVLGLRRRTADEARLAIKSIEWGLGPDKLVAVPQTAWRLEAFCGFHKEPTSEFLLKIFVDDALLDRGNGSLVMRIIVEDEAPNLVSGPPISVYCFEAQRFFRSVHRLSVEIRSGITREQSPGGVQQSDLWTVPLHTTASGLADRVEVRGVYDESVGQWLYSFDAVAPTGPVAFAFRM
jgi:hypothetical protein